MPPGEEPCSRGTLQEPDTTFKKGKKRKRSRRRLWRAVPSRSIALIMPAGPDDARDERPASFRRVSPLTTQRSLVVGDVAGLVDPFRGEGLSYAMRRGPVAAQASIQALREPSTSLVSYENSLAAESYPEVHAVRNMAVFIYHFPRIGYAVLQDPDLIEAYFAVLRGRDTYQACWKRVKRQAGVDRLTGLGLLRTQPEKVVPPYDRVATRYDQVMHHWKRLLGEGAWKHLESLVPQHVRPGAHVLDAGTGTGTAGERLRAQANLADVVGG